MSDIVELVEGKYRIELDQKTGYRAFRYGEPWPAAQGSKLVGALAWHIVDLRQQLADMERKLEAAEKDTAEAIQAAVREKLEEVAALLDAEASGLSVYRDQVNLVLGFRRMSKEIRALIKQEK